MKISAPSRENIERAEAADRYLRQRNFDPCQVNGQRVSVHRTLEPEDNKAQSGLREVFIGKLPRDLFEDELLPVLEKVGRICKIRLMMDFSGTNRGFAFAEYATKKEAQLACKLFIVVQLRPGSGEPPSGVKPSFDNKKLYLSNLPVQLTEQKLRMELDRLITGVQAIELLEPVPDKDFRNAKVAFKSHAAATQARRILCPDLFAINDRIISVEWNRPVLPTDCSSSPAKSEPNLHHNAQSSNFAPAAIRPKPIPSAAAAASTTEPKSTTPAAIRSTARSSPTISRPRPKAACAPFRQSIGPYIIPELPTATFDYPNKEPQIQILGEKTRQMLASLPPDPQCTTLIENINLKLLLQHLERFKSVLELEGNLTVTGIFPHAPSTLEVTYEDPYQAWIMFGLVNKYPNKFNQLAVPGRQVRAHQGVAPIVEEQQHHQHHHHQLLMPDINANYNTNMNANYSNNNNNNFDANRFLLI